MQFETVLDEMLWESGRGVINWDRLEYELDEEPAFYEQTLDRAIQILQQLKELTPDDGDRSERRYRY